MSEQTEGEMVKKINGCDSCQKRKNILVTMQTFIYVSQSIRKIYKKKTFFIFDKTDLSQMQCCIYTHK